MNTFAKITDIENIRSLGLRAEAVDAAERGETVWYRASSSPHKSEVIVFENGRVGVAYNATPVWGESCVEIDDAGLAEAWKAELDETGPLGERLWIDADGRECCCYQGCEGRSSPEWIDDDCDRCCALHWAQGYEYVWIVAGAPSILSNEAIAEAYVSEMNDRGWSVEVRAPRRGEAEGTYYRKRDGTLQVLGYSVPVPEEFRLDSDRVCDALI
jgi:hypothetical protein